MLVLFGAREAGWFREVAALYSDHYRQAPLYNIVEDCTMYHTLAIQSIKLHGYICLCWNPADNRKVQIKTKFKGS